MATDQTFDEVEQRELRRVGWSREETGGGVLSWVFEAPDYGRILYLNDEITEEILAEILEYRTHETLVEISFEDTDHALAWALEMARIYGAG